MFVRDDFITEFDPVKRVFHLSAKRPISIKTRRQLDEGLALLHPELKRVCQEEKCYLISDLGRICIDPALTDYYARKMQELYDLFVYPNGMARYGYTLGRVTAQMGYERHLKSNPNIFGTKQEALDYIESLIGQKTALPNP